MVARVQVSAQTGSATGDEGIDDLPLLGADAAQLVEVITEYVRHSADGRFPSEGEQEDMGRNSPIQRMSSRSSGLGVSRREVLAT